MPDDVCFTIVCVSRGPGESLFFYDAFFLLPFDRMIYEVEQICVGEMIEKKQKRT